VGGRVDITPPKTGPPLIYIAGPYTKPDPVENTHRIIEIADALWNTGVIPVVPHLSLLWQLVRPRPYEDWLEYDLHLMARCDAVLRVRGASQGADREVCQACENGQPVIFAASAEVADCLKAIQRWQQNQQEKQ